MASGAKPLDVEISPDGRLIADGWHGYACDECDHYHIELLDKRDKAFAAFSIGPDSLVPLARVLMSLAGELARKGLIEQQRMQ